MAHVDQQRDDGRSDEECGAGAVHGHGVLMTGSKWACGRLSSSGGLASGDLGRPRKKGADVAICPLHSCYLNSSVEK